MDTKKLCNASGTIFSVPCFSDRSGSVPIRSYLFKLFIEILRNLIHFWKKNTVVPITLALWTWIHKTAGKFVYFWRCTVIHGVCYTREWGWQDRGCGTPVRSLHKISSHSPLSTEAWAISVPSCRNRKVLSTPSVFTAMKTKRAE